MLLQLPNTHVISVDEKTGIQAIERDCQTAPQSKGGHQRREYEYTRHGTTTLIAATNVENGQLVNHHLRPTRTETDFVAFSKATANQLPEMDKIVFLADQLNTHLSQGLVCWIAELEGYEKAALGIKGKSGILKNQPTRKTFLEQETHRIRFIYTPKHCSWLNPIENWFAKLERHLIKNGHFISVHDLEVKIEKYISFYNLCLAKPIQWKFKGFSKNKKLANIKCSNT